MSIVGLMIGSILGSALLFTIIWPFRSSRLIRGNAAHRQRERALTYYERILTNIRDLDEDHSTGKIAENEYRTEREFWADRGVRLLKLLDDLDAQNAPLTTNANDEEAIDAAIEAAITNAAKQQRHSEE